MASGGVGGGAAKCCQAFWGFIFTAGFIVLLYWAIFQPHHIRAAVKTAALSNLTVSSYTNASTGFADVYYHLAVTLNLTNPSVRTNIYYDAIYAQLRYRCAVIGPAANDTSPSVFFQRGRTRDELKLEFDYWRLGGVTVAGDMAGELDSEAKSGPVSLELYVDLQVRYVFRMFKLRQKPRIRCSLSIPVKAEGRRRGLGGSITSGDRCKVKY